MRNRIRSSTAILFGIVLILGAFYLRSHQPEPAGNLAVVDNTNELRGSIEETDSDGDGVSDWEEELRDRTLRRAEALPELAGIPTEYKAPTTLTGRFAESFFREFLSQNIAGATSEEDRQAFLYDALYSLEKESRDPLITKNDIVVSNDNSLAAQRTYGNAVADITFRYSTAEENELAILEQALREDDAAVLEKLDPIILTYTQYVEATKQVPVPSSLTREHLNLLNTYQALQSDITAMRAAFDDPLLSMVRTKRYEGDVEGMYLAFVQLFGKLKSEGITYAEEEPAAVFNIVK